MVHKLYKDLFIELPERYRDISPEKKLVLKLSERIVMSYRQIDFHPRFGRKMRAAIYVAQPRQSDGKITWRLFHGIGAETWSVVKATRIAEKFGAERMIPFKAVFHGMPYEN